jgi:hypothetical protein
VLVSVELTLYLPNITIVSAFKLQKSFHLCIVLMYVLETLVIIITCT